MCVNFRSASRADIEAIIADDQQPDLFFDTEIWPLRNAPLIRLGKDGQPRVENACFGLLPPWSKDRSYGRRTTNARTETVDSLVSFKQPWAKAQFGLVPIRRYFEPHYGADGKPVRWSIAQANGAPVFAAAIWSWWPGNATEPGICSFSMLTMNCDAHIVLRNYHAPSDEKRSLIWVEPGRIPAWLRATPEEARTYLQLPSPEAITSGPEPLPPRTKKAADVLPATES